MLACPAWQRGLVRAAACGWARRVIRMACSAYGKASPAATVTALRGALLPAAVPAAGLPVADRDQALGQVLELGVQAGIRHYAEAFGIALDRGAPRSRLVFRGPAADRDPTLKIWD